MRVKSRDKSKDVKKQTPISKRTSTPPCMDINYKYKDKETNKYKWAIMELRDTTDLEESFEIIERSIINLLGSDTHYFIPIYREPIKGEYASVLLFEGYIFIRLDSKKEDSIYKFKTEHIKGPLMLGRGPSYVLSKDINDFKTKLKGVIRKMIPKKGTLVTPRVGTFNNLKGKVLEVDRTKLIAYVEFERSTRIVEAPINIVNLRKVEE